MKTKCLTTILSALAVLLASCDRECACPSGCNDCGDCWCDCCGHKAKAVVVNALMPEGATAASFHLDYSSQYRDFNGSSVTIYTDEQWLDLLMYNNDSETVYVNDLYATTNNEAACDTLWNMPTHFFCGKMRSERADTINVMLGNLVNTYNIYVELLNNDGRVVDCRTMIVSGMARRLHLPTLKTDGSANYRMATTLEGGMMLAQMTSWAVKGGKQMLYLPLRLSDGKTFVCGKDISQQVRQLPKGGDIFVSIDVGNAVPMPETVGGTTVDVSQWETADSAGITI